MASFEEICIPQTKNRLPPVKYKRDFLHFFKRIDDYNKKLYSRVLLLDKKPLEIDCTKTYDVMNFITAQSISSSQKYLAIGFEDGKV